MRRLVLLFFSIMIAGVGARAASPYDNPDTIFVARDGTGQFRTVDEALEVCRAFMDYHKVIYVKRGIYKEKLVIPQWLQHIEICGEDRDATIITWDDHANIRTPERPGGIGTFRTYTLKIEGSDITLRNITIENNAARLGQAVALHTEGDRLTFINCRFLGHQDTVYTGRAGCRHYFFGCYIEGTTDFIFGPATAWFEQCDIYCKADSYITAASTPAEEAFGYVFNSCTIRTAPEVSKVYLGRPWRDYGATLFMRCQLPAAIRPEGWHRWQEGRERTARYAEFENQGAGSVTAQRVGWSRQLSKKEARDVTLESVFRREDMWMPDCCR